MIWLRRALRPVQPPMVEPRMSPVWTRSRACAAAALAVLVLAAGAPGFASAATATAIPLPMHEPNQLAALTTVEGGIAFASYPSGHAPTFGLPYLASHLIRYDGTIAPFPEGTGPLLDAVARYLPPIVGVDMPSADGGIWRFVNRRRAIRIDADGQFVFQKYGGFGYCSFEEAHDAAVTPDGALWFTDQGCSQLVRLGPDRSMAYCFIAPSTVPGSSGVGVREMAVGADGALYVMTVADIGAVVYRVTTEPGGCLRTIRPGRSAPEVVAAALRREARDVLAQATRIRRSTLTRRGGFRYQFGGLPVGISDAAIPLDVSIRWYVPARPGGRGRAVIARGDARLTSSDYRTTGASTELEISARLTPLGRRMLRRGLTRLEARIDLVPRHAPRVGAIRTVSVVR